MCTRDGQGMKYVNEAKLLRRGYSRTLKWKTRKLMGIDQDSEAEGEMCEFKLQ